MQLAKGILLTEAIRHRLVRSCVIKERAQEAA